MKKVGRRSRIALLIGYLLAAGILVAGAASTAFGGPAVGIEGGRAVGIEF